MHDHQVTLVDNGVPCMCKYFGLHVDAKGVQPSPSIEYELLPTSAGVCITCTFPDDSVLTDCVAVVHQRVSQLGSSGLMNIESSHKFNRSGDTARRCIGVDMDRHQVGVIGGREVTVKATSKLYSDYRDKKMFKKLIIKFYRACII